MTELSNEEAARLTLRWARMAAADLDAAWRLTPPPPMRVLNQSRVAAAQSRARAIPVARVHSAAADLADAADAHERAVGSALRSLGSALRNQARATELAQQHRLQSQPTAAQREKLLEGRRPTQAQLAALEKSGVGPRAVLKHNDVLARGVLARLQVEVDHAVRSSVTADVLQGAARQRGRASQTITLADVAASTSEHAADASSALRHLHAALKSSRTTDDEVAATAELVDAQATAALAALAPLAIGLDRWIRGAPGSSLRYRPDVASAALNVASAYRGSLLVAASARLLRLVSESGVDDLVRPWRIAARELPPGSLRQLDGSDAPASSRVRGVVASIESVQVGPTKRIAVVRTRRGPSSGDTMVLPYFNPIYVGLVVGSVVEMRLEMRDDVFAEFTNASTRARLGAIADRAGTTKGGVFQRRDVDAFAENSFVGWMTKNARPAYDALPDSIDGRWSLGRWFALAVATDTLA